MKTRPVLYVSLCALLLSACGSEAVEEPADAAIQAPTAAAESAAAPETQAFYGDEAPVAVEAEPEPAAHDHGEGAHTHEEGAEHSHDRDASHAH